jgi:preprotein translocase subunit SecG
MMSSAEHGHERALVRATWTLVGATVALVIVTALLAQATWAEKHRSEPPVAGQEVATTQHR